MAWTARHYTVVGGFLAALAAQLSGMADWSALRMPAFWAGILGQLGAILGALYSASPSPKA